MIEITRLTDDITSADLATLAAPLQADPTRFQAYFGDDADEIADEIGEVTAWREHTWIARSGSRTVGWLIAEHDDEIGRVWWWGPVVADDHDWLDVGHQLIERARSTLGDRFEEFEFAVDGRHHDAIVLAERHGYRCDAGSVLLRRDIGPEFAESHAATMHDVVAAGELHAPALAALHDELFPSTHLTGTQVVASTAADVVLVAPTGEGGLAGYVRAETQPGGHGYLDFLGVAPSSRRTGVGRALVERAVAELVERGASDVSLTVRETNTAARALYDDLGFDGSRILLPLRVGFAP